jgi:hypothetical protein
MELTKEIKLTIARGISNLELSEHQKHILFMGDGRRGISRGGLYCLDELIY